MSPSPSTIKQSSPFVWQPVIYKKKTKIVHFNTKSIQVIYLLFSFLARFICIRIENLKVFVTVEHRPFFFFFLKCKMQCALPYHKNKIISLIGIQCDGWSIFKTKKKAYFYSPDFLFLLSNSFTNRKT